MTTTERAVPTSTSSEQVPAAVMVVLREALLARGRAGGPVDANRLAARAWASLRVDAPAQAETINRTMHVLARMEAEQSADPTR